MDNSQIYYSSADLTLWLKTQAGDTLSLSDVPSLIPLRWSYFRDNWEFLKEQLEISIDSYDNKDLLLEQLDEFTDFINVQKTSNAKTNPFSDSVVFFRYYTVFDIIDLNLIPLNNDEQDIIDNEINRVKQFTKNDFVKIKKNLQTARDEFADTVGTSDPDYNRVFNRSAVPKQTDLTTVDVLKMQQFMNGIKSVEYILANIFTLNTAYVDPFALAKANANNPEIDFDAYKSGKLVRINYGEDLQSLANRYLGSPDKWFE
jgi:chorismate mutase